MFYFYYINGLLYTVHILQEKIICINNCYLVSKSLNQMNSGYISWGFSSLKGSFFLMHLLDVLRNLKILFCVYCPWGQVVSSKPRMVRELLLPLKLRCIFGLDSARLVAFNFFGEKC